MKIDTVTKAYLAKIGRKGGKKKRLTREQAQAMAKKSWENRRKKIS